MTSVEFSIPLVGRPFSLYARQVDGGKVDGDNKSPKLVLIVLHGGPGLSDHREVLHGIQVSLGSLFDSIIFWDQLGCGKSPVINPGSTLKIPNVEDPIFSMEGHVLQLESVLSCCHSRFPLGTNYCILGHSWGGQVVLEWLLRQTTNNEHPPVVAAVVSNTPLDEQSYQSRQSQLRQELDPDIRAFYEQEERSLEETYPDQSVNVAIYRRLIGLSETNITGEMKDWTILCDPKQSDEVSKCAIPCLYVATKDDTTPYQDYETLQSRVEAPHHVEVLSEGGHGPFFGSTARTYSKIVASFLQQAIQRPAH